MIKTRFSKEPKILLCWACWASLVVILALTFSQAALAKTGNTKTGISKTATASVHKQKQDEISCN